MKGGHPSLPLSRNFRESSFILSEILNSTDDFVQTQIVPKGHQGQSSNIDRFWEWFCGWDQNFVFFS
jgi:hypothetical protein